MVISELFKACSYILLERKISCPGLKRQGCVLRRVKSDSETDRCASRKSYPPAQHGAGPKEGAYGGEWHGATIEQEYLRIMWPRYQCAGRAERSARLDEVTQLCGYHRTYALGLLSQRHPRRVAHQRPTYSAETICVLAWSWEESGDRICASHHQCPAD